MKVFLATLDNLYSMLEYVRPHALSLQFSDQTTHQLELALEEALVNIIHYAYLDQPVEGYILLTCQTVQTPPKLIIQIEDEGVPFNPLEFTIKCLPTHERGGYGIYYLKQIMDEVKYFRRDNRNVLVMVKYK